MASILLQVAARYTPRADPLSMVARLLRGLALRVGWDPACDVRVSGLDGSLMVPLSHQMPFYRARFPQYDRLPKLVAGYLRASGQPLRMVDVGANVGDTVLTTRPQPGDRFLALEPHPVYFAYLLANLSSLPDCTCLQAACGTLAGKLAITRAARGTAGPSFERAPVLEVEQRPLDAFWSEEWDRAPVNFVKVDTDGFDAQVIHGAPTLLSVERPWLLYECDVFLSPDGVATHRALSEFLRDLGYTHAAAFDNFGNFQAVIDLADAEAFLRLLASQCREGPVHYHDMLLAPDRPQLDAFLADAGLSAP